MPLDVLQSCWPYLLILFYMMVLAFIKTLLGHFRRETAVHNLLRESKTRRNEYLKELDQRMHSK
ncbi:MAG: hypothetical protein CMJ19_17220 [Phycisphaeraceae bacterium]|nr:hypothetical protein [Phycisphaeraceae bacterium]|tara:strand:+ start:498 stop:689 length:192 start_codon:yes stop_codon:yes gene_type:complete